MSTSYQKPDHDARRAARAEAAAWVVRLHGPHRSSELEAVFRLWLAEDPEHARQFERVTDVWDYGARVRVGGLSRAAGRWRSPRMRSRALAASGAMACLVVAVLAYQLIRPGTVYRTGIGEPRVVRLEDGSRITLDANSEIRVAYSDTERRVRLEKGEAYFTVKHNPSWPFVAVAGNHQVTDIGTAFVVRYASDRTAVTLIEGSIAVSSRSGNPAGEGGAAMQSSRPIQGGRRGPALWHIARADEGSLARESRTAIILTAGQRVTFEGDQPPKLDEPRMEDVTAWVRGEVTLDDTPLSEAIAELNRYDASALVIEDPRVARLRVSGIYHTGDNREFALMIGKLYGLRISPRRSHILLSADTYTPR